LRILLDECVPRGLKRSFRPLHVVLTVPDAGLAGYKNGLLLRRIVGKFDVFITTDKSIQHQQRIADYDIAFVLLRAPSNDITDLQPLVPKFLARIDEIAPGKLLVID
jgi:hypothetical protein